MLTVMDMSTGKLIASNEDALDAEFGKFREQVLNAEWVPARPELQLAHSQTPPRSSNHSPNLAKFSPGMNVEDFLASMYCNQR